MGLFLNILCSFITLALRSVEEPLSTRTGMKKKNLFFIIKMIHNKKWKIHKSPTVKRYSPIYIFNLSILFKAHDICERYKLNN